MATLLVLILTVGPLLLPIPSDGGSLSPCFSFAISSVARLHPHGWHLPPFPRASLLLGFPLVITSIPALRCYKVPTSAALALTRANGSKADSRKHRAHRCSQCCGGLVSSRDGRRTRRLTLRGCVLPAPGALPTQLTSCCLDLTYTSNHSGSLWCKINGCFLSMYIELQSS